MADVSAEATDVTITVRHYQSSLGDALKAALGAAKRRWIMTYIGSVTPVTRQCRYPKGDLGLRADKPYESTVPLMPERISLPLLCSSFRRPGEIADYLVVKICCVGGLRVISLTMVLCRST